MGAYDAGALAYLGAGWWPIPVLGKTIPVCGSTGYEGTVTPEKIAGWLCTDMDQRARNGRGVGVDSIAIRHRLTLAIDVDHGYGDKDGVQQLRAYADRAGLPPLPATWSSTARGANSASRQHLYRIPADVTFKTKPCQAVELCAWHHRFTVCWPTIHPGTGTIYRWYLPGEAGVPPTWDAAAGRIPRPSELLELPTEWFVAFRGGAANADRSSAAVPVEELLATFAQGDPDGMIRHLIEKWNDEAQHVGHDEAKNALINAFMLGREGHPGVPELVQVIVDRLAAYLDVARPEVADRELYGTGGHGGLIRATAEIAQQKPLRPVVIGRMPTADEFMAGASVGPESVTGAPTAAVWRRPPTKNSLRGLVAKVLATDPERRAAMLAWMARRLAEYAAAGHLSQAAADGILRDTAAAAGIITPSGQVTARG